MIPGLHCIKQQTVELKITTSHRLALLCQGQIEYLQLIKNKLLLLLIRPTLITHYYAPDVCIPSPHELHLNPSVYYLSCSVNRSYVTYVLFSHLV